MRWMRCQDKECCSGNLMKRKQTPHPSYSQMLVCHLPPLGKAWSRGILCTLGDNQTKRVCACTRERVQIAPRCARRSRAEREAQSTKVHCTERSIIQGCRLDDNQTKRVCACTSERVQIGPRLARCDRARVQRTQHEGVEPKGLYAAFGG